MIGIRCRAPRMMLPHARQQRSRLARESRRWNIKWKEVGPPMRSPRTPTRMAFVCMYVFGSNLSITASARRMYCVASVHFVSPLPIISFATQHPQHLHSRPVIASTAATTTQRYRHCPPPAPRSCQHARHQRALQTQFYLKPRTFLPKLNP
jgi:hypothetical protein